MANIASVLKDEIARVARKELRVETEKLKKASGQYRADIAALKRRVADLERQVSRLEKAAAKHAVVPATPATGSTRVRFSAEGLSKHRQRLGLSAVDLGILLGVSGQTIYNWEAGKSQPRTEQKVAIAGIRALGKRDTALRLAELQCGTS